jgi:uroporphyrinogen decarboxylase
MKSAVKIELFYTLMCPNCKIMKHLLDEVLPSYGEKFKLTKSFAGSPAGMIRTMKMGIHTVPTLVINNEIVFKSVPNKQELINKLNLY